MERVPLVCDVPGDYYDLDAVLAAGSTVPMTVKNDIPSGILELFGGGSSAVGSRIEVPLYLASVFLDADIADAIYPSGFNSAYQNILNANATSTPLSQLHSLYYTFGLSLCRILPLDLATPLSSTLLNSWIQRIGPVVVKSLQGQDKIDGISNEELSVFLQGIRTVEQLDRWRRSGLMHNSRKRKLELYNR